MRHIRLLSFFLIAMGLAHPRTILGAEAESAAPQTEPRDASAEERERVSAPSADPLPQENPGEKQSKGLADTNPVLPVDPEDVPAAENTDETPLLQRAASEAAWQQCVALLEKTGAPTTNCLENLLRDHPHTAAAYRAEGALMWSTMTTARNSSADAWQIPGGRLELSSTAGLFGIWSGIAIGSSISAHLRPDETLAILGTGALAIGLGTGLGFGGYHLAEQLDLGEGDSRWIASSLVWGTVLGIAAIPPILENNLQGGAEVSLPLMTIVSGGLLGGVLSLGATRFHRFSSAEVSMLNTGGWVGVLFGFLTLPTLEAWNINGAVYGSLSFIAATSLGLTSGFLLSQVLDLNWGETLLLDLGGVLGLVTGGTLLFALTASGALESLPGQIGVPLVSAGLGLSAVSGMALTALSISISRSTERPIWKASGFEIRPTLGPSHVVLDLDRKPTWIFGSPTIVF